MGCFESARGVFFGRNIGRGFRNKGVIRAMLHVGQSCVRMLIYFGSPLPPSIHTRSKLTIPAGPWSVLESTVNILRRRGWFVRYLSLITLFICHVRHDLHTPVRQRHTVLAMCRVPCPLLHVAKSCPRFVVTYTVREVVAHMFLALKNEN